jgi:hypothetical protein
MAKRAQQKIVIAEGTVKGRLPRAAWAMTQASMGHAPAPKSKIVKVRGRRSGKAQCDPRAW